MRLVLKYQISGVLLKSLDNLILFESSQLSPYEYMSVRDEVDPNWRKWMLNAERLGFAKGLDPNSETYTQDLESRVKAFLHFRNLKVDGKAGKATTAASRIHPGFKFNKLNGVYYDDWPIITYDNGRYFFKGDSEGSNTRKDIEGFLLKLYEDEYDKMASKYRASRAKDIIKRASKKASSVPKPEETQEEDLNLII